MLDVINGLPVHPLVVHAVVVLLPLAALGVILVAIRPAWLTRYGGLVCVVALLATIAIPLATESGEALEHRVGDPGRHAELGDTMIWFAIPLVVVAGALVWLRRRTTGASRTPALHIAVAVLAVVVAGANLVQVYRVGDSGAHAVWKDLPAARPRGER